MFTVNRIWEANTGIRHRVTYGFNQMKRFFIADIHDVYDGNAAQNNIAMYTYIGRKRENNNMHIPIVLTRAAAITLRGDLRHFTGWFTN